MDEQTKNTHPLKALLYENEKPYMKISGGILPEEKRKKFLYVVGQIQRFNIHGYSVKVYAFLGIDGKGRVSALPVFFYTGANEDVPWEDIVKDVAEYGDFDKFVISVYENELKTALKKRMPNAELFSTVYSLPSDAAFKSELGTINIDFDKEI